MKFYTLTAISVLSVAALSSCSDWTDPKPIDIKYETIEDAENYQSYLESLREYRASDHTLIYAWVDLSDETPKTQGERLTALPDSIDVLVVSSPTNVAPAVTADLQKVRTEKGMKAIFGVDYDELKASFDDICAFNAEKREKINAEYALKDLSDPIVLNEYEQKMAGLTDPIFKDYIIENLNASLAFIKKHSLDGALFAFDGKQSQLLDGKDLVEYTAIKNLFLDAAMDWSERNPDKMLVFMGNPQNLDNDALLDKFDMFLLRGTLNAASVNDFSYIYQMSLNITGLPADKVGVMTAYASADEADLTTGFFPDGTYLLDGMASWLSVNKVAAVGVKNVQYDYFYSPKYSFPHVRALIQAANPKY